MEHKIGEIITLPDGRKAEVVEGYCIDCIATKSGCLEWIDRGIIGECLYDLRTDGRRIIYKEIKEE